MRSRSFLLKVLLTISLAAFLNACSSNSDSEKAAAQAQAEEEAAENLRAMQIDLSEVSSDKCLNIQKYFEIIRSMPAVTKARKITSNFDIKNGSSLPRNFYMRLAAGNFQVQDGNLSELPDFMTVEQAECDSVVFRADGHDEIYKIKKSTKESVTLENDWQGQLHIQWRTPFSVDISTTSVVGDYLCSSSSKAKLTVTHNITWGNESIFTDTLAEKAIDTSYLSVVSDATGFAFNSLYLSAVPPVFSPRPIPAPVPVPDPEEDLNPEDDVVPDPEDIGPGGVPFSTPLNADSEIQPVAPEQRLVVVKLKELQSSSVRPDLLMCY
jgi:hypothetical protein